MFLLSFAQTSCGFAANNPAPNSVPDAGDALVTADESQEVQLKQIVLAGGCFWCTEAVIAHLDGVTDVVSGYSGGLKDSAHYEAVSTGTTKHAEVIAVTYDPTVISLGQILKIFFTVAHDPTQLNRQGGDVGTQYRSAVFYDSDEQKQFVADYIQKLDEAEVFSSKIVTTLEPLEAFYPAEDYHQDFAEKNPNQGYVRQAATPKVEKLKKYYPEKVKEDSGQ